MIRTEREYEEAVKRLGDETVRLEEHRRRLEEEGLEPEVLKRALDPIRSFHDQLQEEVHAYERLKRGNLDDVVNLRGLGSMLVALRIARGLSQTELARRLDVHVSQISRDERNEYHGVTVQRASRILEALAVELRSGFEDPVLPEASRGRKESA